MLLFGKMIWLCIEKIRKNHLLKLKVDMERLPCREKEWDECVIIHPDLQKSLLLIQSVHIQS